MRKSPGLDVIDGDLPPGVFSLSRRVDNLTTTLDGTAEQPEIGLISRVKAVEDFQLKLMSRLNLWGGILLGAFAASGFANGAAPMAIKAILKAFAGAAG